MQRCVLALQQCAGAQTQKAPSSTSGANTAASEQGALGAKDLPSYLYLATCNVVPENVQGKRKDTPEQNNAAEAADVPTITSGVRQRPSLQLLLFLRGTMILVTSCCLIVMPLSQLQHLWKRQKQHLPLHRHAKEEKQQLLP